MHFLKETHVLLLRSCVMILTTNTLYPFIVSGPTIGSLDCMNSGKEGHVVLYHKDCYPFGAIGPVSFLWRQNCHAKSSSINDEESGSESPQLWIWAHPACFDEVFQAIQEACETVTTTSVVQDCATQLHNPSAASQEKKTTCSTKQEESITMCSLRFDLARFRLTGPLSHPLLVSTLELPGKNENILKDDESSLIEKDIQSLPEQNGSKNTGIETSKCGCNLKRDGQVGVDEVKLFNRLFMFSYFVQTTCHSSNKNFLYVKTFYDGIF